MANITFKNEIPVKTAGDLPKVGTQAPDFKAVKADLGELSLSELKGKRVILNIFPSLDTGVCAASVRRFNKEAAGLDNTVVLCLSKDLPFAQGRFCAAEGIENVITLSTFRCNCTASQDMCFDLLYKALMLDGPLAGLYSRAVVVIDTDGTILYTEQVPEVTEEPNYEAALAALK